MEKMYIYRYIYKYIRLRINALRNKKSAWDMSIHLIVNHNFILFKIIHDVLAVVRNNVFLRV